MIHSKFGKISNSALIAYLDLSKIHAHPVNKNGGNKTTLNANYKINFRAGEICYSYIIH